MDITRIILRCTDLERSLMFWRDAVGLSVTGNTSGFAFLAGGTIELVLNQVPPEAIQPSLTELVFEVDDVVASHKELAGRGVPFEVEPRPVMEADGRQLLVAHFRDPDGNLASISGWTGHRLD